jgi:hypothetical protein
VIQRHAYIRGKLSRPRENARDPGICLEIAARFISTPPVVAVNRHARPYRLQSMNEAWLRAYANEADLLSSASKIIYALRIYVPTCLIFIIVYY